MRDEWDDAIDEVLAGYAGEPRPGIERRVLHRVRAEGARKRFGWAVWGLAAVAVCGVVVTFESRRVAVEAPKRVANVTTYATAPRLGGLKPGLQKVSPRRAVFPTPTGLTDGERALVELFHQSEGVEMEAKKGELEPIEIAPIEIPALKMEGQ